MALQDYFNTNAVNQFVVASTAQLPNVSGATIQTGSLQVGDQAIVSGTTYYCYDATIGSAIWSLRAPINPFGIRPPTVVNAASATLLPNQDYVQVTYVTGTCTLTLPTVLGGAPIGTEIRIQKSNTSASAISVTPDAGATINAGVADAAMTMEGSTAVSSTTTSDDCWILRRTGALTWRASNC